MVSKALKQGLRPIVAINKIDRPDERHDAVLNEIFDLFANLDATDEQLDFPVLYGSGRDGWMAADPAGPKTDLAPLFELVAQACAAADRGGGPLPPAGDHAGSRPLSRPHPDGPHQLGQRQAQPDHQGDAPRRLADRDRARHQGAGLPRPGAHGRRLAEAGDIVAIAGITQATVADTLCDPGVDKPFLAQPIDPPTLAMMFRINDGPFAGQEGDKVQSRVIRDRLLKEAERNVAIRVSEQSDNKDAYEVAGRGELQLGILIETMRREGFELTVSRPRVVFKIDPVTRQRLEPIEEVIIDVDEEHSGVVVQKLSERRGDLRDMRPSGGGRQRLVFHAPTRGLIGYQGELLTDTRGTAVMNRLFHDYAPFKGESRRPTHRRPDLQRHG